MLANEADVLDGLLTVDGGGWTTISAQALPIHFEAHVAMLLQPPADASVESILYSLLLIGPRGDELTRVDSLLYYHPEQAGPVLVPGVAEVRAWVTEPGVHRVVLCCGDEQVAETVFEVVVEAERAHQGSPHPMWAPNKAVVPLVVVRTEHGPVRSRRRRR
jgi:hypothetical protein